MLKPPHASAIARAARTGRMLGTFVPSQLAELLQLLVAAGVADTDLFHAAERAAVALCASSEADARWPAAQLVSVLDAFARAKEKAPTLLAAAAASLDASALAGLTGACLCQLLRACARAPTAADAGLVRRVAEALRPLLAELAPADLSEALWALERLRCVSAPLLSAAATALGDGPPLCAAAFSAEEMARTVHALAALGPPPSSAALAAVAGVWSTAPPPSPRSQLRASLHLKGKTAG